MPEPIVTIPATTVVDVGAAIAERSASIAAKHAAAAAAAIDAEDEEPEVQTVTATSGDDATPSTPAKRDNAGRFTAPVPKQAKEGETPAEPGKEPAKEKVKDEVDEAAASPGAIAKARRLLSEALEAGDDEKLNAAFKLAFGKPLDEIPLKSRNWAAFRVQIGKKRAAIEREKSELYAHVDNVIKEYEPFQLARKALEAGRLDEFLKLASGGMEVNDFQQRLFRQRSKEDPRLSDLARKNAELERRFAEAEAARQQEAAQRGALQAIAEHKEGISSALKDSGDTRFQRVATKQAFIDKVFAIQRDHFDGADTIPPIEAAELAWEELYGDVLGDVTASNQRDRGATLPAKTPAQARQPARQATRQRAAKTLDGSVSAEAATPPKLKGEALRQYWVKRAQQALDE